MSTSNLAAQLDSQRRKVDFDTYDIIVQQLVTMVESSSINVAPLYQRQFRWDEIKRSHLVESVLLGVPVPSLFMAANRDGTWELVDGVQRLSTLVQFAGSKAARAKLNLDEPLVLRGLAKLTDFNGLGFADLPNSLQLHLKNRPIKVITLSDKSDLVVRFDLFERLNTGGVALTNQEIRACVYRGSFNTFLERMGGSGAFKKVVRLRKVQELDGTREECALRFFAFLHRYKQFEHSVVEFLNTYMEAASKSFEYEEGEQIFKETFKQLAKSLPNGIVRTPTRKVTPINLFEGVAVGAALAIRKSGKLVTHDIEEWIQSHELEGFTTAATNIPAMVVGRIEFCRDRFLGK